MRRLAIGILSLVVLSGCYHATVETGLTPGPQTIDVNWASGWIYGLVPPSTVEAMDRCTNGVARVETQLSFLNQLVSGLTFGIFTPMQINVGYRRHEREGPVRPSRFFVPLTLPPAGAIRAQERTGPLPQGRSDSPLCAPPCRGTR